jgi:hypothetical protein
MIVHTYLSNRERHWTWNERLSVGRKTYRASIVVNGKTYFLGEFPCTKQGETAKLHAEADLLGHLLSEARA